MLEKRTGQLRAGGGRDKARQGRRSLGRCGWSTIAAEIGQGQGGCESGHRCRKSTRTILPASDVEGIMRKIVLLITATALFLCSVEVWAGGAWSTATPDSAVFVICNAL